MSVAIHIVMETPCTPVFIASRNAPCAEDIERWPYRRVQGFDDRARIPTERDLVANLLERLEKRGHIAPVTFFYNRHPPNWGCATLIFRYHWGLRRHDARARSTSLSKREQYQC